VLEVVSDRKLGQLLYTYSAVASGTHVYNAQSNEYIYVGTGGTHDQSGSTTEVNYDSYKPEVISYSDYYPFHMQMEGRSDVSGGYRYHGANGQESEREITGSGSHSSAEYWMYDGRLGRRWNVDPLYFFFAPVSPYCTFLNNPIRLVDPLGLAAGDPIKIKSEGTFTDNWVNDAQSLPQCADDGQSVIFEYENNSGASSTISSVTYTYNASTEKWSSVWHGTGVGMENYQATDVVGSSNSSLASLEEMGRKSKNNDIVANNGSGKIIAKSTTIGSGKINNAGGQKSSGGGYLDAVGSMWKPIKDDFLAKSLRSTVGFVGASGDWRKAYLTKKITADQILLKNAKNTPRAPIKNSILLSKTEIAKYSSKAFKSLPYIGLAMSFLDFNSSEGTGTDYFKLGLDVLATGLSYWCPAVGVAYWGVELLGDYFDLW